MISNKTSVIVCVLYKFIDVCSPDINPIYCLQTPASSVGALCCVISAVLNHVILDGMLSGVKCLTMCLVTCVSNFVLSRIVGV